MKSYKVSINTLLLSLKEIMNLFFLESFSPLTNTIKLFEKLVFIVWSKDFSFSLSLHIFKCFYISKFVIDQELTLFFKHFLSYL